MSKPLLWLLLADWRAADIAYVIPTVAWMAADAGASFEVYLESERDGRLFAETGSTVLGGAHHQQFNYLCSAFDLRIVRYGQSSVFASSVEAFGLPVILDAATPTKLYSGLLARQQSAAAEGLVVGPPAPERWPGPASKDRSLSGLPPYLYPEIFYRRALGLSAATLTDVAALPEGMPAYGLFLNDTDAAAVRTLLPELTIVDAAGPSENLGSATLRIAQRWSSQAKGVVFGDPAVILAQLASHCRRRCVAVYEPLAEKRPAEVQVSQYTENVSPVAGAAAELALEIGNRVITGRQTGDGDIFEWSKRGVSIQIVDPNRPVFPVVETIPHRWAEPLAGAGDDTPSDEQLEVWADEGRVLTTLVFHSGEVAHNEAMLAMVEMVGWSGLKLGLGVHAARYETAPQTWELLQVPPERGGARGLVEPLLHSGGLGVLAECNCAPTLLRDNCVEALRRIAAIAGPGGLPFGYYAFMDSNHDRLDRIRGDLFQAVADAGLDYIISSALPGRNRILWRSADGAAISINQTPRVVEGTSPFVRATTPDDLRNTVGAPGAGWILATFDAPVISFAPYIWREGSRFLAVVDALRENGRINVTPSTVARYARLLSARGVLPEPVAKAENDGRAR